MEPTDKIRHFLANVFTILNLNIEEEAEEFDRKWTKILIKMASFVNSQQELFIEDSPALFKQDSSLKELIIQTLSIESKLDQSTSLIPPKKDLNGQFDRYLITQSIRYIIDYLKNDSPTIEFKISNSTLIIIHTSPIIPPLITKPLYESLSTTPEKLKELKILIAQKIFNLHNLTLNFTTSPHPKPPSTVNNSQ